MNEPTPADLEKALAEIDETLIGAGQLVGLVVDQLVATIGDTSTDAGGVVDFAEAKVKQNLHRELSKITKKVDKVLGRIDQWIGVELTEIALPVQAVERKAFGDELLPLTPPSAADPTLAEPPPLLPSSPPVGGGQIGLPGEPVPPAGSEPCPEVIEPRLVDDLLFLPGFELPFARPTGFDPRSCVLWFHPLSGAYDADRGGVDPGLPWVPVFNAALPPPALVDKATCRGFLTRGFVLADVARSWTIERSASGMCAFVTSYISGFAPARGDLAYVRTLARDPDFLAQICPDQPCQPSTPAEPQPTEPPPEPSEPAPTPDGCCPVNPKTQSTGKTEGQCCFPCPVVEESDIRNVRILPWGQKQGREAWIGSPCGEQALQEAFAKVTPVGVFLDILEASSPWAALQAKLIVNTKGFTLPADASWPKAPSSGNGGLRPLD